jgi:hypothetical protein
MREPSIELLVVFTTALFRSADSSEDMKMAVRKGVFSSIGRGVVLASVAAMALAAIEPSVAMAGGATPATGLSANHGSSGNTDISAAGRRHYGHGGGGAAAMAAFAGIVGTIGSIAAAQERRDYYYSGGPAYYGGGPAYYGGGPVYYGAPAYGYYGGYGASDTYDRPDRTYN